MGLWVFHILNSLSFAAILFILSVGLSLIFGLMRIPNLSHGALFMLGAYLGVSAIWAGLWFAAAMVVAGMAVGLVGTIIERGILRRISHNENAQVLATIGIAFIIGDLVISIWGGHPVRVSAPEGLRHSVSVFGTIFPAYRIAVIAFAVFVALAMWLIIEKTRIGAMLRAGVDDLQMARAVGIPASALFTGAFALGSFLAGIAGLLAGPVLSVYPGMDFELLPLILVAIILGGSGSLLGSVVGSIVVGILHAVGPVFLPELAYVILFLPMVLILAWKPAGLFGRPVH
jgi:branched-chain amino acid transport system permease protein